jgi:hypothetical protein
VIGDGVYANPLAARILWAWMVRDGHKLYRLLSFTCSTHAANLVVKTAICGDQKPAGKDGTDGNKVVATSVRLFKYLIPEYGLEFGERLRQHVKEHLLTSPNPPKAENVHRWEMMQTLYGKQVQPDKLLTFLNGPIGKLQQDGGRSSGSREAVATLLARELERLCLKSEEKPTPTRFFLFTDCIAALFRWVLLRLPPEYILNTGAKNPRAQNHKRIDRVTRFFQAADSRLQLSIACLCVRLTTVATAMTAKKLDSTQTTPLLVLLARGGVTRRASSELPAILSNITHDLALGAHVGLVVERLLLTMGELVLRFHQYEGFPGRVVLLSRKFNRDGCYAESMNLLTCDEVSLDLGYSLPLRREAWSAGDNVTTALAHIFSDTVQEEINTIAVCVDASTLDVERKHNLDRRVEARTVNSLQKASRDSFIRFWRQQAAQAVPKETPEVRASRKRKRRAKHMNQWALALSKRPDLAGEVRSGAQCCELKAYVTRRRAKLQAELVALREGTSAAIDKPKAQVADSAPVSWPLSRQAWVAWLDDHGDEFASVVQDMRRGARRHVNARVVADPQAPEMGSVPLLLPKGKAARPSWARLVRRGWYVLCVTAAAAPAAPPQRLVLFIVSAGHKQAAWAPKEVPGRGYEIACDINLAKVLKPLWEAAPAAFLTKPVSVFRLGMQDTFDGQRYCMLPVTTTEVLVPPRSHKGKGGHEEGCGSSDSGVDGESGRSSGFGTGTDSEGCISLASTGDSSLEEDSDSEPPATDEAAPPAAPAAPPPAAPAAPAGADESGDSEDASVGPRAAAHTHTSWANDYFVLTDNRNYMDMRMRIRPRWTGPDHLGSWMTSKTLRPANFGDTRTEPDQILLVLKAWMLHRWQGNGGKFLERRSRRAAWELERDALAADIERRGGGSNLEPKGA